MSQLMTEAREKRALFFQYVFGDREGWVTFAKKDRQSGEFAGQAFHWPEQRNAALDWVEYNYMIADVYYCPHLFGGKERIKENVTVCPTAWADLDRCHPDKLLVEPTIVIESSPGRYQALWLIEQGDPYDVEDISKRIAYAHKDDGCDQSGWDLTQLLRIPFTYNHKYDSAGGLPLVKVTKTANVVYTLDDFDVYPTVDTSAFLEIPFPEPALLITMDPDEILERYRNRLLPVVLQSYAIPLEHNEDTSWSESLWRLEMGCFEAGMTREEVFVVAKHSACNKYKRDNRPETMLWREILRAWAKYEQIQTGSRPGLLEVSKVLTDAERDWVEANPSIVDRYVDWARGQGDAAWQYHEAGAFILLSSILAGSVKLPTSYGTVVPNLWFMILADTTLTRKTTAMDMAMDLLTEIDADCVLATDGSIEGLFTSLATRPGRPSIFLRDEFSGLLEMMTKRDYYAGMAETLTKLYDGKFQKRVLRKETLEVRDPVLILFAGGIKTRILSLLTYEHVASGFMPRFILVCAESDVTALKPLGPPTTQSEAGRQKLRFELARIHEHYAAPQKITIGERVINTAKKFGAELTPDAWAKYNAYETNMLETAIKSQQADILTPTFDRLSKSGLKISVLLAAARQVGTGKVLVEEEDVIRAFYYIERWREHSVHVINNIGKTAGEKNLDNILRAICREPGIARSHLMQGYHLNARDCEAILQTLDQRGQITRVRRGRTELLYPITGNITGELRPVVN